MNKVIQLSPAIPHVVVEMTNRLGRKVYQTFTKSIAQRYGLTIIYEGDYPSCLSHLKRLRN